MPKIQESAENYLETILVLKERNGTVRSVDIAAEMGFSKPSVSVAMRNLREQDCITMCEDGLISLTEKGRKIAESVYERHTLFTQWLVSLGVDPAIAAQDACRIEHVLSRDPTETTPAWISRRAFLFAKGKPVPLSRDWRRERAFFTYSKGRAAPCRHRAIDHPIIIRPSG